MEDILRAENNKISALDLTHLRGIFSSKMKIEKTANQKNIKKRKKMTGGDLFFSSKMKTSRSIKMDLALDWTKVGQKLTKMLKKC